MLNKHSLLLENEDDNNGHVVNCEERKSDLSINEFAKCGVHAKRSSFLTLLTVLSASPHNERTPNGRNGVEHSEALRRVVRVGSRGTICPQRGKLD